MFIAVLVGAGLTTVYFHPWRSEINHPVQAPAQTVQKGPGFAVKRQIGAWTLECPNPAKLPAWAKGALGQMPPPPKKKTLHCRTFVRITAQDQPHVWVEFILSATGPTRILNVHMKLASGPAAAGDVLKLHIDNAEIPVRVLLCGRDDCVAVPMRRPQEVMNMKQTAGEQVVAAKSSSLLFPGSADKKAVTVNIPTSGLQEAVAAMQKIEPMNTQTMN